VSQPAAKPGAQGGGIIWNGSKSEAGSEFVHVSALSSTWSRCVCQPWLCAGVQSLLVHANRGCVQGCLLERANHGRVQGVCACMPNRVVCRGVCLCKLTVVVREGVCLCKPTIMVVCRGVCVCMPTMVVCSDVCVCMPTIAVRMGVCFPVSLKFVPDMAARPPCTWQVRSTRGAEPLAYEGGMCVQSATARGGSMDEP
jgi:hypothetical protein